ncbi:response regulator transcription factor [Sulfurimonas marina]|uniref:Response regulator transcription factor n=1 Tax=Sulfurimonas marina TaxID=2590551 RepID=A0A7M3V9D0_9BACT|nr:response regulator transcription factor [Sulfurimonas marina]QOP40363.1 response regulator transcription factor [Sulfurimonas marina]
MKHRSRILVIDDEATCNFKLCTYLKGKFKEVYSASSGEEGWQMYLNYLPDVIISDINMPNINGTELVSKIRKIDKECFIILMTAYSDEQSIETIANLQINSYFIKPMTSEKLSKLVNNIYTNERKLSMSCVAINDTYWYDALSKTVKSENMEIKLNNREITVLEILLENQNRVVTYEMFNFLISDNVTTDNAIRILIGRLRKKIPSINIESVYKVGYILKNESPKT